MCGIAGFVGPIHQKGRLEALGEAMANAVRHRGPDSMGVWSDESVGLVLAHRRLAIQDLSPLGHQPMQDNGGRYTISYNGEIYNFLDLRQELSRSGYGFKGHSDTEVLLAAVRCWGLERALEKCIGMYALALFDREQRLLHLVRDRIGEKPLYYGNVGKNFVFGSELKALFPGNTETRPNVNRAALASYLRYGYISAPLTIYDGIFKVKPGSILTVDLKKTPINESLSEKFYWTADGARRAGQNNIIVDADTAIDELDALINKIIQRQAIADVPVGAFLSGGIDSSTVAACLQANSGSPTDTFSIGFYEKSFNEAEHAKQIAKHIGSTHHELYLGKQDILDVVPNLPTLFDEPFADSSQIPMCLVSALAKKDVTVCLSGDGGDELFAGYNRYTYTQAIINKARRIPRLSRTAIGKGIEALPPAAWDKLYALTNRLVGRTGASNTGNKLYKLRDLIMEPDPTSAYKRLCSYWQQPASLLTEPQAEPLLDAGASFDIDFLGAAMLWDQKWYLPGDNLVKTDRASMGVSLEMRLPLLDAELIEFAWRLPNSLKINNHVSKWILRQVLYKYVPASLVDRPKMGFTVPISQWIRNELREWCDSLLDPSYLRQQRIFDVDVIHTTYRQHLSGRYDHGQKLWTVLQFQDWYKNQSR